MLMKYLNNLKIIYAASLSILLILLPACNGKKYESPSASINKSAAYGVVLHDNAALRIDPIVYSSRVALLKKGERVEITDQSKVKGWIGNISNYWYKIRLGKGINGWIFGNNLKLFSEKESSSIDNYLSNLRDEEEKELKKNLAGKWWSINRNGDYTSHSMEIFENGKYKSQSKGGKEISGDYNFNFKENEIIFLNNTTFGFNLKYVSRGTIFYLEAATEKQEMRFKKIHDASTEAPGENNDEKTTREPKTGEEAHDQN
jgi:hypothetical protein